MQFARRDALAIGAAAMLPMAGLAQPARWPSRPIRFISPFAAGGPQEVPGRIIAEHLTQRLGQPVVIEPRPGAASALGSQLVARETDGHTFLFTTTSLATLPALMRDPGFDALADLVPVTLVSESSLLLAARAEAPYADLPGLIRAARESPGRISYGSSGVGSSSHLSVALLCSRAGIEMLHVPYRGAQLSLTAVLSGEVAMNIGDASIPLQHIREGRMKGICVTTRERSPILPEVGAAAEVLPGYSVPFWFAILAPRATPPEVAQALMREMAPLAAPDSALSRRMAQAGAKVLLDGPEALTARLRQEIPQWRQVAAAAGITPE